MPRGRAIELSRCKTMPGEPSLGECISLPSSSAPPSGKPPSSPPECFFFLRRFAFSKRFMSMSIETDHLVSQSSLSMARAPRCGLHSTQPPAGTTRW